MNDVAVSILLLQACFERLVDGREEDGEESYLVFESKLQMRRLARVAEICQRFLRYRDNREEIYWLESRKSYRGEAYIRFVITPLDISSVM
jgi:hypothetical protein